MLQAALGYATKLEWDVGPLHEWRNGRCTCYRWETCSNPAKHPRWVRGIFEHGLRSATRDPDVIRKLWSYYPTAGVFRNPGEHEVVLDIAPRAGGDEALAELEREHGALPETVTCLSGGGGNHLYFTTTEKLKGTTLAPGVELKGPDQLLALPPSLHKSGNRYQWDVAGHPLDIEPAQLPEWIVALARKPERPTNPAGWAAEWFRTSINPGDGRRGPDGLPKIVGYLRGYGIDCETAIAVIELWDDKNPVPLGAVELRKHVEGMYGRYGRPAQITFNGRRIHRLATVEVRHAR